MGGGGRNVTPFFLYLKQNQVEYCMSVQEKHRALVITVMSGTGRMEFVFDLSVLGELSDAELEETALAIARGEPFKHAMVVENIPQVPGQDIEETNWVVIEPDLSGIIRAADSALLVLWKIKEVDKIYSLKEFQEMHVRSAHGASVPSPEGELHGIEFEDDGMVTFD